jgi:glycosyltransferase involved in cell wall biosynthesis
MNRKKRILMVGEASYTCSGFGTYTNEVMQRLAKTGKYELAELASYGLVNDPKDSSVNWRFYANAVREGDPRLPLYHQKIQNQWGEWRLDRVLLDFKPDIVWDIRDPWMLDWEKDNVFRKFFHWVIMPTVDSAPQQESWIDTFSTADGVFTYSDWSLEVLRKESNGKIKLQCSAPPGTSLDVFKPIKNKAEHKLKMGLNPQTNLIGTVMRNQRRKLYPDIFHAFSLFLEKCNERGLHELGRNTYLFIHTSYPDAGWNIPKLLRDYKISHRVIFSYICRACGKWFASPFQDAIGTCPYCRNVGSAILPCVAHGVSSDFLADIMKCFDLYLQISICEGFGMPQVEAASCGVPSMGMKYSATDDILSKTNSIGIKIAKDYLELETQAFRMMPDNNDLAEQLIRYFNLQPVHAHKLASQSRQACEKFYNYDNTAKIWETYFDSVQLTGLQGKWDAPPDIYDVPETIPPNLDNVQFVAFLFNDVLHEPDLKYSLLGLKLVTDLNIGATIDGTNIQPITREQIFNATKARAQNKIFAEKVRAGLIQLPMEDYINYAEMKSIALNTKSGDII